MSGRLEGVVGDDDVGNGALAGGMVPQDGDVGVSECLVYKLLMCGRWGRDQAVSQVGLVASQ